MEKVHGVDFSHHQKEADFEAALQVEKFIIHKATEGRDFTDSAFIQRSEKAVKKGILWGAYLFFGIMSQHDPKGQVDHFLSVIDRSKCPVVPIVDLEQYCGVNQTYYGQRPSLSAAETMVQYLHKKTGIRPIIYGNPSDLEAIIDGQTTCLTEYPLWIAHYTRGEVKEPTLPSNQFNAEKKGYWEEYALWQYTDKPLHDKNWFNGTEDALRLFWAEHTYVPKAYQQRYLTQGVSLSHGQSDALFQAKLNKHAPIFIKATEGINCENKAFHERAVTLYHHNQRHDNNIPWCAWHLFSTNSKSTPEAQANDFLNVIQKAAITANTDTSNLLAVTFSQYKGYYPTLRNIQIFLTEVERKTGMKMIIQGTVADLEHIFKDDQNHLLNHHPLYIEKQGSAPAKLFDSQSYQFWAYTHYPYTQFKFQGTPA